MKRVLVMLALALAAAAPASAEAFCGFYVSGADTQLYNNATQVVLMRAGTRTVLSMQNNYQGPPENFAMVVPVPVVLKKDNVKTLPPEAFKRVDSLAAPRLVEYWEQDPCFQPRYEIAESAAMPTSAPRRAKRASAGDLGVVIEAKFAVAEYQVVILSAKDSTGLDTWLRQEKYKIPEGAEPYLRPYVKGGSKFFVAKVDTSKVTFKDGQAMLSPLRFHYDSEEFSLPIRLGMMNSAGVQDLIVHILAPGQRYEVANYRNATIPTNINVEDSVRERFGEFYAALFDRTLEKNPGAVITEYSWDASSCDPCPTPALSNSELLTLGLDVLYTAPKDPLKQAVKRLRGRPVPPSQGSGVGKPAPGRPRPPVARRPMPSAGGFVLTRLHARYGKGDIKDDLVFKAAPPIAGGREFLRDGNKLEEGAVASSTNQFQGRYAIRHEWTGPIECENPRRGIWGGPPAGVAGSSQPRPALELAFAPRGAAKLPMMVAQDVPEIDLVAGVEEPESAPPKVADEGLAVPQTNTSKNNKGCSLAPGAPGSGALSALAMGLLLFAWRRQRG